VVQIEPASIGLTVIGGRNRQGKTSVLDAILWGLGGAKHKPSNARREDSSAPSRILIELDNGLIVTREGKNASLKVIDQYGNKAGQSLLDELIGQMAIDLPSFLRSSTKEKAETLLRVTGVGEKLAPLDAEAEKIYNERHSLGQIHIRKKKHAEDLPFDHGAPEEEVSASELIQQQQAILARNGENQKLLRRRDELERTVKTKDSLVDSLSVQLDAAKDASANAWAQLTTASTTAANLTDESTAELEASLQAIDETNRRVRINAEKQRAEAEAADLDEQIEVLSVNLEIIRDQRQSLLDGATLPLPGLSVVDGELTLDGLKWDCLSSADQLRVGVAIVRTLRPECRFVLLDKLEQMDVETLAEFGQWLEQEDLQAIATRVSTGDECSVIIEDGMIAGAVPESTNPPQQSPIDEGGF
jgi:hypothetical protein